MPTFSTVRAALLPLGFLLLAAGACTDLNETVYDEITDTNFKPGEKDLGSLVAPAYRALADMYMGRYGIVDVAQEKAADVLGTPGRVNGWRDGCGYCGARAAGRT